MGGASDKEPACQCRGYKRPGFNPWVRKIPWRRIWEPTSISCLGKTMDRAVLRATVHGVTESQTGLKLLSTCAFKKKKKKAIGIEYIL